MVGSEDVDHVLLYDFVVVVGVDVVVGDTAVLSLGVVVVSERIGEVSDAVVPPATGAWVPVSTLGSVTVPFAGADA